MRLLGTIAIFGAVAAAVAYSKGYDAGMSAVDAPLTPEPGRQPTSLDPWAEINRIAKVEAIKPHEVLH